MVLFFSVILKQTIVSVEIKHSQLISKQKHTYYPWNDYYVLHNADFFLFKMYCPDSLLNDIVKYKNDQIFK